MSSYLLTAKLICRCFTFTFTFTSAVRKLMYYGITGLDLVYKLQVYKFRSYLRFLVLSDSYAMYSCCCMLHAHRTCLCPCMNVCRRPKLSRLISKLLLLYRCASRVVDLG